jgi:hypothetical protein
MIYIDYEPRTMDVVATPFSTKPITGIGSLTALSGYQKYRVKEILPLTPETIQQSHPTPPRSIYISEALTDSNRLPQEVLKGSVIKSLDTFSKGAAYAGAIVTLGTYPSLAGSEDQIFSMLTKTFDQFSIPAEAASTIAKAASSASKSQIGQAIVIALSSGILSIAVLEAVNPTIARKNSLLIGLVVAISLATALLVASHFGVLKERDNTPSLLDRSSPATPQ